MTCTHVYRQCCNHSSDPAFLRTGSTVSQTQCTIVRPVNLEFSETRRPTRRNHLKPEGFWRKNRRFLLKTEDFFLLTRRNHLKTEDFRNIFVENRRFFHKSELFVIIVPNLQTCSYYTDSARQNRDWNPNASNMANANA